jgi:uncharacterized phiE125 gp8 family phage protein
MNLSLQLITPPAAEPVSLELAKLHLRVDFDDEDAYITALIIAARQYAEKVTRRAFFDQTWMRTLDFFPVYNAVDRSRVPADRFAWPYPTWYWDKVTIDLPYPRLVSVESILYTDSNGVGQTLPTSSYTVDTTSMPGRIAPAIGMIWPWTNLYRPGSVKITFIAGSYGDGVEVNTCPQTIVQAMLLLIGHWYQHREAVSDQPLKNVPLAVEALLAVNKANVVEYR